MLSQLIVEHLAQFTVNQNFGYRIQPNSARSIHFVWVR